MTDSIVFDCHYCHEPAVAHTGPQDNGDRSAAVLELDGRLWVFCSPACRHRWIDVVGNDSWDATQKTRLRYADSVSHAELNRMASHGVPVPSE